MDWQSIIDSFLPPAEVRGKGWNDPGLQQWAAQQLSTAAGPTALGWTKIVGEPGGNRLIQSFHDVTNALRGELGYKDVLGKGAIIQSFRSQSPEATREMYGAFNREMGPLLNNVKVQGNIRPEAWGSVQGVLDRGVYNQHPQLEQQWQRALEESRGRYPDVTQAQPMRWGQ